METGLKLIYITVYGIHLRWVQVASDIQPLRMARVQDKLTLKRLSNSNPLIMGS